MHQKKGSLSTGEGEALAPATSAAVQGGGMNASADTHVSDGVPTTALQQKLQQETSQQV